MRRAPRGGGSVSPQPRTAGAEVGASSSPGGGGSPPGVAVYHAGSASRARTLGQLNVLPSAAGELAVQASPTRSRYILHDPRMLTVREIAAKTHLYVPPEAAEAPNPFDVLQRMRHRCEALWMELDIDEKHRDHITATCFNLRPGETPDAQRIAIADAEIRRLVQIRVLEHDIAKGIDVRERFLCALFDLGIRLTDEAAHTDIAAIRKELRPLLSNLRRASIDVIALIKEWRDALRYDAVYLWRGTSYLLKMSRDVDTLGAFPPLVLQSPCLLVGNPLLNPSRRNEVYPIAKPRHPTYFRPKPAMLPPLLRRVSEAEELRVPDDAYDEGERILAAETKVAADARRRAIPHAFPYADDAEVDDAVVGDIDDVAFDAEQAELRFGLVAPRERPPREPAEVERMRNVTVVQSLWRKRKASKKMEVLRRRTRAALRLQRWVRKMAAAKQFHVEQKRLKAAVKIQALARGVAVREWAVRVAAVNKTATVIQRAVRAFLARKEANLRRGVQQRIIRAQKLFRGHAIRKRRTQFEESSWRVSAATTIQSAIRGWLVRRRLSRK